MKLLVIALAAIGLTSCASMQADLSKPYCEVVRLEEKVQWVEHGDKMNRRVVDRKWVMLPEGCRQRPHVPSKFSSDKSKEDREKHLQ